MNSLHPTPIISRIIGTWRGPRLPPEATGLLVNLYDPERQEIIRHVRVVSIGGVISMPRPTRAREEAA